MELCNKYLYHEYEFLLIYNEICTVKVKSFFGIINVAIAVGFIIIVELERQRKRRIMRKNTLKLFQQFVVCETIIFSDALDFQPNADEKKELMTLNS